MKYCAFHKILPILIATFFVSFTPFLSAQQLSDTTLLSKEELKKAKVYTSLTDAFKEPEKVVILDLSGQNLDSLPSAIDQFKNLQVLRLGFKIKDSTPKRIIRRSKKIGGGIIHLDRLQGIYVDYNYLKELPPGITDLTKLQEVHLSYNNLTEVPVELTQLKNLKFVNLIGCYGLLTKKEEMKEFRSKLPADCVLWSDLRLE